MRAIKIELMNAGAAKSGPPQNPKNDSGSPLVGDKAILRKSSGGSEKGSWLVN